ncbi:MAG: type IV pilus biogenesis/stability protein PilW [Pseudomonadota bacterium]
MRLVWLTTLAALVATACVTTEDGEDKSKASLDDAAEINYQLGSQYLRQGDLKLARERLERSISQNPDLPGAHIALALVYEQTGDVDRANSEYRRALKVAPKDANALNSYAVFLCKSGRHAEGQRYFLRAADVPQNLAPEVAYTNAGVCALEIPDNAVAESHFRTALTRNPEFADALLQMAVLSLQRDDTLRARAFVARFESAHTMTAEALLLAVRVEKAAGDAAAMTRYAERLRRNHPDAREAGLLDGVINDDG